MLFAYGGAGPLHAVEVAREIGMRNVIVPFAPGVFSAFGMLFADLRYDFVRPGSRRWKKRTSTRSRRSIASSSGKGAKRSRGFGQTAEDRDQARCRHALCRAGACGDGRSADVVFTRKD